MTVDDIIAWLNAYPLVKQSLAISGVLILSILSFVITRKYILNWIGLLVKKSKSQIDDFIFDHLVAGRIAFIPPLLIVYNFAYLSPSFMPFIHRICYALLFFIFLSSFIAFLGAVNQIYEKKKKFKNRPIKSYIQAITIVMYILGILIMIGILTGQSLWALLSGVGAITAVIMLIFRDTILSFVASLEITSYDLVRLNDWIEVPKFGADGDVIDISLHTIKVQNFDKTITVIPTHQLIEQSFKNWRGMQESGGRRIKRAIHLDISSIKFCNEEMLARLEKIHILKPYLDSKREEIKTHNQEKDIDMDISLVNGRRLTNIGTFRAYIGAYLKSHEKIHGEMTFLVRQLAPGPTGVPIEIYVFTNDTAWANYEVIQADIFDHLFAVINEFELTVFQYPAGKDIQRSLDYTAHSNASK